MGVTYFVGIGSYLMSVGHMPVALAVIIFYTFPILTALAHALVNRRRPGLVETTALFIAFSGLYIALEVETEGTRIVGILFAATASFSIMLNMLGSSHLLQRIPTTLFAFYQALSVCLLSTLALAFSGGLVLPHSLTGAIYLGIMLLAFLTAYLCSYNAIRLVGPVSTSTIMNLEPLATILFAFILLGEILTWNQAIGGAIVLAGIVLAQRYSQGEIRKEK
jgi:drug/metabolite transporter (DMT)-like permease